MPGFLGGSTGGSSTTGGEISFPKEFIDPVTKLRISQPENLIDTDFEYGLQPTKWETVELINNTPSFFSKSGDTTIPNIVSISTNNGTREITVITATEHGLAVGIPINVTGTKSVTADGSYIINSIPNQVTFTYLCKDNQQGNNAIEDLYSSIITGEFFQGSQIRIADAEGVTTDAAATSTLTVKTDSTHGFGLGTPFYFLNLNSTISQEFEASNTAAKSFDSSNSATAQTFDGSNTLSTFNIDWSNSATVGGVTSAIASVNTTNDTITVTHGAETFASKPLGTPLYYNLTTPASSGFFADNPRGVVFLKTTNTLNSPAGSSTFQVSSIPDGDTIDIVSSMQGTFQLANQARTFAGNNISPSTELTLTVVDETPKVFDGANDGGLGGGVGRIATITGYSGSQITVTSNSGAGLLDYYPNAMIRFNASGGSLPTTNPAGQMNDGETYWVDTVFQSGTSSTYIMTIKRTTSGSAVIFSSGGTATTQTFTKIGISIDKDIVHIKDHGYVVKDMLRYDYPVGGHFGASGPETLDYYFVENVLNTHNFTITNTFGLQATGGTEATYSSGGVNYKSHTFLSGTSTFTSTGAGDIDVLIVAGGGGGGSWVGAGGGAGGVVVRNNFPITAGSYSIVVGNGGAGGINPGSYTSPFPSTTNGQNSTAFGLTAIGGGKGGSWNGDQNADGGSGGGASQQNGQKSGLQPGSASGGFGNAGGANAGFGAGGPHATAGGGGAGAAGQNTVNDTQSGAGGIGIINTFRTGANLYYGGGGGGGMHGPGYDDSRAGLGTRNGNTGGGGNGKHRNNSLIADQAGLANTGGGGGGGGAPGNEPSYGGAGGSGIVVIRYRA
jgi:hypothetical protein